MAIATVSTFLGESIGSMAKEKIGDYLLAPIGRQLSYFFFFKSNIMKLETQLGKLETTRQGVQYGVDEDKRNVRIIAPDVEAWLNKATAIAEEAKRIIDDKEKVQQECLKGWCPNFKLRYLLSRKAVKKTIVVVEVHDDGIKYTKSSYDQLPESMQPLPPIELTEFQSRSSIVEMIIQALMDDQIDIIAITGMGGVGKTTMAEEVARRAKKENLFDEVAMVVVSQNLDLLKVQSSLAKKLGLKLEGDDLKEGASRLRLRLQQQKKILIILDDVWVEFNLTDLGILLSKNENKSCKVLFTSRNNDLWCGVKSRQDFPLEILTRNEARDLFSEKAGNVFDDPNMQKLAKDIVLECGGLPLALVTIGSTLRNQSQEVWRDALRQLRAPSSERLLSGVPAKVYPSLEFSYNYLEEPEAKSLFLLCSFFEEDADISLELLLRYGFGLKLFQGIDDLNEAKDRVYVLVNQLLRHNLLIGQHIHQYSAVIERLVYVRMHDIVRDVAISIAAQGEHGFLIGNGRESIEWAQKNAQSLGFASIFLRSGETLKLQEGLRCPKLQLLTLKNEVTFDTQYKSDVLLETLDNFCQGTTKLKVFNLGMMKIQTLPSSLTYVTELRNLHLCGCQLKDISVIGELQSLEILDLQRSEIEELPREIGLLANLKLLDLSDCISLERIAPGVISNLRQLQQLYMNGCKFSAWEGEGREEGKNASLKEFNSLTHLNTLEIRLDDGVIFPRIPQFSNLTKYTILLGSSIRWEYLLSSSSRNSLLIELDTCTSPNSECGIGLLLKKTNYLDVGGDCSEYVLRELVNQCWEGVVGCCLESLAIHNSNMLKAGIGHNMNSCVKPSSSSSSIIAPHNFSSLENSDPSPLMTTNLRQVIQIPAPPFTMGLFPKLRHMYFYACPRLANLFDISIARELVHLEYLGVGNCDALVEIICIEEKEEKEGFNIQFPKLEMLRLTRLPSLISFCRGLEKIESPQPQLKELPLCDLSSQSNQLHNAAFSALFSQQVEFPALRSLKLYNFPKMNQIWSSQPQVLNGLSFKQLAELVIDNCNSLPNLFSPSVARHFENLRSIHINGCLIMEEVLAKDENDGEGNDKGSNIEKTTLFPKLKRLILCNLPNLRSFSHFNRVLEFPLLEDISIDHCPQMKIFFHGSLYTPNLSCVYITEGDAILTTDDWLRMGNLNDAVLYFYEQGKERIKEEKEEEYVGELIEEKKEGQAIA